MFSPSVTATSVLGVSIGAPLVQNGSDADVVVIVVCCATDIGKMFVINKRDSPPINIVKGQ